MDSSLLLSNAIEFKKAALRCLEKRDNIPDKIEILNFPAVMNFSFSIELLLKYILTKKGIKFRKVHHIGKLMYRLDTETLNLILFLLQPRHPDFHDMLKIHSNSFDEWRYKFEKPEKGNQVVNYEFLKNLANALLHISENV
ncbi:HEPN domain-containing protein [Psychroserpens luteolus]|uniref:HEPN domain-containing protein n=1 Tax=Psychroserpens luteolus TaxID=2855840 RepID=UPI001E46EFA8|nr:HEPN domain-containing protein [Psychroserpens luteolus]MCD2260390.1 HEPN domain-containing protein [Psychroserpens luteolus]